MILQEFHWIYQSLHIPTQHTFSSEKFTFKILRANFKHQNLHRQRSKVPWLILSIKSVLLLPLQIVKHVTNWHSPNSRHIHSVHVHTERALVWLKISANQKQLKYSWLQGEHVNDCKQSVLRRMAFIITRKLLTFNFCT